MTHLDFHYKLVYTVETLMKLELSLKSLVTCSDILINIAWDLILIVTNIQYGIFFPCCYGKPLNNRY